MPEASKFNSDWKAIQDQVALLFGLQDDWDGEGTLAPASALVEGAIRLTQKLQAIGELAPDRVHPSVNSTIYFEWHAPQEYREIEVVSPNEAECRIFHKGSNTTEAKKMVLPFLGATLGESVILG
ncbi:hypothetical protein KIH39_10305 [Telmatocola sphagniphila]|uniref:Uncharacterized protein n=1 Tax=Telmatocola sphagniphila TaxID=1123043 RepID=A0A8E6B9E2_9BACT|nr:hypothetical protein [Telmatocola sphagniphila]QVL34273.1 hypothetical protein KIH39_10305 [Telmatocola sphagniphila]